MIHLKKIWRLFCAFCEASENAKRAADFYVFGVGRNPYDPTDI